MSERRSEALVYHPSETNGAATPLPVIDKGSENDLSAKRRARFMTTEMAERAGLFATMNGVIMKLSNEALMEYRIFCLCSGGTFLPKILERTIYDKVRLASIRTYTVQHIYEGTET
jgi:hypothetical protein